MTAAGLPPQTWLQDAPTNTIALIIVAVWIWTGFCMVILSAALKSISPELMEAARVDGANELQVFRRITFPLLLPAVAVVATTMVITALKAFDIVYVMTSGNFDTNVVANQMYKELFTNGQPGRASAIAVVLLVLIVPGDVHQHPAVPRAGGDPMTVAAATDRDVPVAAASPTPVPVEPPAAPRHDPRADRHLAAPDDRAVRQLDPHPDRRRPDRLVERVPPAVELHASTTTPRSSPRTGSRRRS